SFGAQKKDRTRHDVLGYVDSSKRRPASRTPTRYPFSVRRNAATLPPKPDPMTTTSRSIGAAPTVFPFHATTRTTGYPGLEPHKNGNARGDEGPEERRAGKRPGVRSKSASVAPDRGSCSSRARRPRPPAGGFGGGAAPHVR